MKKLFFTAIVAFVSTSIAQARIIEHEVTPGNTEQRGWRVEVANDEEDPDLIHFTIWQRGKDRTLKEGTTATLVVRDGKRLVSSAGLGLENRNGKNAFVFSVAASCLKDSRFKLLVLDPPHPSGDLYWIDLKKFHDARKKQEK